MLVEMALQIGGTRDGAVWPPPGGCIDVPDYEAESLITAGYAKEAGKGAEAWSADTTESGPEPATDGDADTTATVSGESATVPKATRKK